MAVSERTKQDLLRTIRRVARLASRDRTVYSRDKLQDDLDDQLSEFLSSTDRGFISSPPSPYTASINDVILWDATAGNKTVNLPAASLSLNAVINIKKTDASANTITVDGDASETIDGGLTAVLTTQYESITVFCDGSNWHII